MASLPAIIQLGLALSVWAVALTPTGLTLLNRHYIFRPKRN